MTQQDQLVDAPVPTAVRRAKEKSEKLHRELLAGEAKVREEAAAPAAEPEAKQDTPTPAPVEQAQPKQDEPTPKPQPAADDPNSETWQQRYRTLQGIIRQKDLEIEAVRLKTAQPTRPTLNALEAGRSGLSPEEVESLGDSTIDATARIAAGVQSAATDKLMREVAAVRHGAFLSEMRRRVPDFDAINEEHEFVYEWLEQIDEFTGEKRKNLLSRAVAEADAVRASNFFTRYKADRQGKTPTSADRPKVEDLATPAPSGARVTPTPPAKAKTYTKTEVAKGYQDFQNGKFRGKESEFKQWERAVMEAARDGRIVG